MLRRRQSRRHTHVADRQMTEAAAEMDLLLRSYQQDSLTRVGSLFIFIKNGEKVPDDIAALIITWQRHLDCPDKSLTSDDDWFTEALIYFLAHEVRILTDRDCSPLPPVSPESALTKQFWREGWHRAVRSSYSLRLPSCIWNSHFKATKISNYSSSRKSEVKRSDDIKDLASVGTDSTPTHICYQANNHQNKKPRPLHLERIWSWRNMTLVPSQQL